ncbi:MAG: FIST C-terminal domain-containing protein [Oscillatoria sp. PMC 1068.18]|nr:FIST C-terminal domain-containing protein [Oscillatoria sp. PMC 1076.18]MEC4991251.1 FIST C-terminal domain-containing protein [Oscillatoria sp. PMC 1068.18]
MANQIQWINALSTRASLEAAVKEVVGRVQQSLSAQPDLGIVFISSAYASDYPRLVPLLIEELPLPVLIGCGGGGIVGMNEPTQVLEVEGNPALSLSVAHLPEVTVQPFHLLEEDLPDLDSPPDAWVNAVGISPEAQPQFILLSAPFLTKINDLLAGLDFAYPESVKVGGLASATAMGMNQSALFYYTQGMSVTDSLRREGTIGVALSGKIVLETIVAQGCRPIGPVYQIAQGEKNIVVELAEVEDLQASSRPPLTILQELIQSLSEGDRQLAQHSLFVGIVGDEFKFELGQGDFLIRNLLGVDPKLGAIAIGDHVRPGQRLQFHLRDAKTSAEDLQLLLQRYQQQQGASPSPVGALMFSCLGRGESLYGKPNFDSVLFRDYLEDVQLSGFFCNGEIGPVGSRTFLHGYTSAFGIFRQP